MKDRQGAQAVGWKVRHVLQPGFFLHTGLFLNCSERGQGKTIRKNTDWKEKNVWSGGDKSGNGGGKC